MASGLAALLDDVAAIAKIAAASMDDVAGAAGKAGSKAVGVVVDDAAVTPGYAMGFTPDRELPIVWKIALGSLRNKFIFLLPGALAMSAFAPWLVTPLLMIGGTYLAFEASEKILEVFLPHEAGRELDELALSSTELEDQKVAGAIRTDLILSAEIMFIALADVAERPFAIQAAALAVVGLGITIGVYGVVGLLVKMDDIGLHLAKSGTRAGRALGRGMVVAMPSVLGGLATIGTAAMLWVGGGILVHGLEHYGWMAVPHLVEGLSHWAAGVPGVGAITGWLAFAAGSAVVGLVVGAVIVGVLHLAQRVRGGGRH
ncbi:DUF808 domain-containing protein [Phenylobacterium sp.]|uniref:DUF808 domain-containing protein n=1 Tax=Phenylobacterium sp. TaxID=1871053 RepID=UPI0030F44205